MMRRLSALVSSGFMQEAGEMFNSQVAALRLWIVRGVLQDI
jgi:hypothetical protein